VVTEPISDAAFPIAPCHSDVDNFVLVGNYIDARLIRDVVPLYCGERYGGRRAEPSSYLA
jgi:hypothetical protein